MENFSDKIQDYIEGLLEGEELDVFEKQMQEDQELHTMVRLQSEVHEILQNRVTSKEVELRNNLRTAEQKVRYGAVRNVIDFRKVAAIAAVFIAVILGSVMIFKTDNSLYELPTMSSEVVRGEEPVYSYEEAVKLFNKEEYSSSQKLLAELIKKEPLVQYEYYWALTFVGMKDWEAAISNLKKIAEGSSVFADEAKYYLAVAYHKSGADTAAAEQLKKIPNTGKLGEKAKKLLNEMD